MWLKLSISDSKWVLQAILSLTVLSKCVSVSSNYYKAFLPDYQTLLSFSKLLGRKFNEDSKNVAKTFIF